MHSHLYFKGEREGKSIFPLLNADEAPLWTTEIISTEGLKLYFLRTWLIYHEGEEFRQSSLWVMLGKKRCGTLAKAGGQQLGDLSLHFWLPLIISWIMTSVLKRSFYQPLGTNSSNCGGAGTAQWICCFCLKLTYNEMRRQWNRPIIKFYGIWLNLGTETLLNCFIPHCS